MTNLPEPVMGDLVPLLYRARWIRFSLSGEVRSRFTQAGADEDAELNGSVLVAPGGRYRAEFVDEDGDSRLMICDGGSGRIPFGELLDPAWLLADYDLRVTAQTEHLGRHVYAVAGSPRLATDHRPGRPSDRLSALVDAELGILLRYAETGRRRAATAEFIRLTIEPPESADPLLFTAGARDGPDEVKLPPGDRLAGPGSPPGEGAPALGDDDVNLLCRSMLGPQRFSADVHERADITTMMRLARPELESTGLGRRTRWLWQPGLDAVENVDRAARVSVAMPGCYRIEAITDPGSGAACIACDGERLWRAYSDRVAVGRAEPPASGIAAIVDPAWLLHRCWRVSAAGQATVAGRPALRVVVSGGPPLPLRGPLSGWPMGADEIEAVVDRELGIVLAQAWSYQGYPVLGAELSDVVTDVDPAAFRIEPPPGTRVITGRLLAGTGLTPAAAALIAAKGASRLAFEAGRRWLRRNGSASA